MADRFRVTLGQLNPVMGDLAGNVAKARDAWEQGRAAGADLVMLPEMFVTGYQTQDLVLKPAFHEDAMRHVEALAREIGEGPILTIGGPWKEGRNLYNAYHAIRDGRVIARKFKTERPNYNVFDEVRVFASGPLGEPSDAGPLCVGTPVCEDAWFPSVTGALDEQGARLLLVCNGSPYFRNKYPIRMHHMEARVTETDLPLVYLNVVGGQDDQVFDGGSFVLNRDRAQPRRAGGGAASALRGGHRPCGVPADAAGLGGRGRPPRAPARGAGAGLSCHGAGAARLPRQVGDRKSAAGALGRGGLRARDHHRRRRHRARERPLRHAALALHLAHEPRGRGGGGARLGMPAGRGGHRRAAGGGDRDAGAAVCRSAAGARRGEHPEPAARAPPHGDLQQVRGDAADHRQQERDGGGLCHDLRGHGGGYNPLKDLYKTRVFQVCRWRNLNHRPWMMGPQGEVIPARVFEKPPSAELRPDQKDEDSLPPYEVLDGILELLVDSDCSVQACVEAGFDRATVKKVEALVYGAEWKRHQSAPGTRLTRKAFWLDRRYPIVNRWRDEGHGSVSGPGIGR